MPIGIDHASIGKRDASGPRAVRSGVPARNVARPVTLNGVLREVLRPGVRALALREYRAGMPELVESLSFAALVAATLEYAIVMRHREERRDAIRWQAELRESLVSAGRSDAAPVRQWTEDGTRFRVVR